LNLLLGMGTHFGQGYLFQRPIPLEQKDIVVEPTRGANAA
jgi:EAL domain-containing protein (putative c-di-GMP-specific phosphodiesterase class I)